jgi:hypothetical protein
MPIDDAESGGGGGDDWLGDKGELDWDADVREPGRAAPRRAATPARPPDAAAAPDPHTAALEATIRRRRAVGLVVALLLVGGLIWLAVAAFGGDSDGTSVTATPTTVEQQPTTTTPTQTTPTQTTPTQTTPAATPPATTIPRPAETISEDERLELESTGDSVERLQVTLKELGFDPGPADGDFGPLTQAAVVAFQAANGLDPDGVVGSITAGALNAALAAQASG